MENEESLHFCGGIFFTLLLKARKKPARKQEECLKDLLAIYDRGVNGMYGNTLSTYASKFKTCDPTLETDYIRLGNDIALSEFNDRIKDDYDAVLGEMKKFVSESLDTETNGKWLVRATLELIEKDDDIRDNAKFFIMPGNAPVYKSELKKTRTIYFYNFLLGVWHYICSNCPDNGVGRDTYLKITEDAGPNKGRKVKNEIGLAVHENVRVVYDTKVTGIDAFEKVRMQPLGKMDDVLEHIPAGRKHPAETPIMDVMVEVTPKSARSGRFYKYSTYLQRAEDKYREQKTFLYETRRPFYDFFVCNDIKRREVVVSGVIGGTKWNARIKNVCIDKFPEQDHLIILSGTGGLGKSMMMTHFMLDTIKKNSVEGKVPVFANLRDYDPDEGQVLDFLFNEFHRHDPDLKLADLVTLLSGGKAVVLMDGLDELKWENRKRFVKETGYLVDYYPDSIYVISSRPNMNFRAFDRCVVYDLQPFTQKQAIEMVKKLDENVLDLETRDDFIRDFQNNRFGFKDDEKVEFLGNPLFLTIMLITYGENHDIPKQRYKFYEQAYDAMARQHDGKKNFTREFVTGLDDKGFKYYFGEFCAITYEQEKYDFTPSELAGFFQMVIDMNQLDTTPDKFIEDITGKICLIYRDGQNYYFVHRSFQEYFTAYFFSKQLEQNYDAVLDLLMERDESDHDSMVLPMLYAMDTKKTELCIFLPFLKGIFANDDDTDNYRNFLQRFYHTIFISQGQVNEVCYNNPSSSIYGFIVDEYDLHESIDGDDLPWDEENVTWEYVYFNKNWMDSDAEEELVLVRDFDVPVEYSEKYDLEVVGHVSQINVPEVYDALNKERTVKMLEDENFPLKREYRAVRRKYEELKETYKKKNSKRDWISRFH